LIRERGIDFEEIIQMLENWDYIDDEFLVERIKKCLFYTMMISVVFLL
jgi:hypothetical protein